MPIQCQARRELPTWAAPRWPPGTANLIEWPIDPSDKPWSGKIHDTIVRPDEATQAGFSGNRKTPDVGADGGDHQDQPRLKAASAQDGMADDRLHEASSTVRSGEHISIFTLSGLAGFATDIADGRPVSTESGCHSFCISRRSWWARASGHRQECRDTSCGARSAFLDHRRHRHRSSRTGY